MAGLYRRPNLYAVTVLHNHGMKEILIVQGTGAKSIIADVSRELLEIYGHTKYTLEYKKISFNLASDLISQGAEDWRK